MRRDVPTQFTLEFFIDMNILPSVIVSHGKFVPLHRNFTHIRICFGSQPCSVRVITVLGTGHNRARFGWQPHRVRGATSREGVTPLHGYPTHNLFGRKVYLTTFSIYFTEYQ